MKWVNHPAIAAAAVAAGLLSAPSGASAQDVAVIAIPSHPEVPVIINGQDASYRLVVGDWGLSRPGSVPVIVYGPPAANVPEGRGYFPRTGRRPHYGRQEFVPRRRVVPPPAPTYRRTWTSESAMEPPAGVPPALAPQVNVTPPSQWQGNHPVHHR